mmetsp:Transcript_10385/g.47652  ORF Transcript_10385/g.47652 Transcript_10385/m.47652 type:complete len:263 (+) Transcript_10385:4274-5062(+)
MQVLHPFLFRLIPLEQHPLRVVPGLLPVVRDGALRPILRRLLLLSDVGPERLNLRTRRGRDGGCGRGHVDAIRRCDVLRDRVHPRLQLRHRRAQGVGLLVQRKHLRNDGVELSLAAAGQRVLPLSHETELTSYPFGHRRRRSLRGGDRGGLGAVHGGQHRVAAARTPRQGRRAGDSPETPRGRGQRRLDGPRRCRGGDRVEVLGWRGECRRRDRLREWGRRGYRRGCRPILLLLPPGLLLPRRGFELLLRIRDRRHGLRRGR